MQNPELRSKSLKGTRRIFVKSGSPEVFQKEFSQGGSSGLLHLVKTSPRYLDPTVSSLNLSGKLPKEKAPRFSDHGLPMRRLSENFQEKGSSRVTELELHIFQLESKLDIVKDQLISAELLKKEAHKDAEDSRKQLLVLSKKFEESRKQASESAALFSVMNEIRHLNAQLESVAVFKAERNRQSESNQKQLHELKSQLQEACSVLEELKSETSEAKKSEARTLEIIHGRLMQLVEAKVMAEILQAECCEATEARVAVASELELSRAHAKSLEQPRLSVDQIQEEGIEVSDEMDFASLKLEVEGLKSALEGARIRYDEELLRKQEETEDAVEIIKIIKFASEQRRDELEAEIQRSKTEVHELTANLLDTEKKLQFSHANNVKIAMQQHSSHETVMEINNLKAEKDSLKAHLLIKEMELEKAAAETRTLKLWISKNQEANEAVFELEKSKKEAELVAAELEALEIENAEVEYELRKLKLQAEQWRKAAEVAVSILSADEKMGSPTKLSYGYEEMQKRRNSSLLRNLGVLWKKQHK